LNLFQEIGENPIILQDYIDKNFEVRYTVVGKEHFVCKIDSQASKIANIDWRRYDLANTPHEIINPPEEIKKKVINLMAEFNLNFGALDFIVSQTDEWHFLELNSMGQFLWIEDLTGLKISESIANWLIINN
jgi:glutathione synthase/RimK-type ligase-like ATP-grasp enzyme